MKKNSLIINYMYNLSFQVLVLIVPLITTPYISRVLNADQIGIYSFTFSIASYFCLFGNLGFSTYGQLLVAANNSTKEDRSKSFFTILFARSITMAICLILYGIFCMLTKENKIYYLLLFSYLIAALLDISWFYQGLEDFKRITIRNFIIKILSVLMIFVCVKTSDDIFKYIIILQGSTLLGNLALWITLPKHIGWISFKNLLSINVWKQTLIYFIPTIATSVYLVLDKSMIGVITHSGLQNGFYEQTHKIEQLAVASLTALSTVTIPRLAKLNSDNNACEIKKIISATIDFTLLISIPLSVGMYAVSEPLILCFLGEKYIGAKHILEIFSFLVIIVCLESLIGRQCLMSLGRQNEFNKGVICGAIANIITNIILIPRYAATGAAIGSIVAELVILIVYLKYSKSYISIYRLCQLSWKRIIASFIMFLLINVVATNNYSAARLLLMQMAVGIISYFSVLLVFKDAMLVQAIQKLYSRFRRD